MDEPELAMVGRLRGRIALHLSRSGDAARLLLDAAKRLESFDPRLARDTHLEALYAASVAGRLGSGMLDAATAARLRRPDHHRHEPSDLLLDGLGVRFTDGSGAARSDSQARADRVAVEDGHYEEDMRWPWLAARVAADLFDDETWHLLATRHLQIARDAGALGVLQIALIHLSQLLVFEGKLDAAAALTDETDSIIDATESRRINVPKLMLAACRGDEARRIGADRRGRAGRDRARPGHGAHLWRARPRRSL